MTDLDNVASDVSENSDGSKALENESSDDLMKELTEDGGYLKGNYCLYCSISDCKGIADQCIKYALPDEKESSYKPTCGKT